MFRREEEKADGTNRKERKEHKAPLELQASFCALCVLCG